MIPPKFLVYVPSKGRPNALKTIEALYWGDQTSNQRVTAILVVEPKEEDAYRTALAELTSARPDIRPQVGVLVLPESDQGIAYVRNFILESAALAKMNRFWMLDDDIGAFTRSGKKANGCDVLVEADALFMGLPQLGQGALEYGQFSWSAKGPLKFDGYCDVAVWIHVERTRGLSYRPYLTMKEDRDFTLQVLARGWQTARASRLGFNAPKNGSNAGGLKDLYQLNGRERLATDRMIETWPGICSLNIKPDGRPDTKIDWKRAAALGRQKAATQSAH